MRNEVLSIQYLRGLAALAVVLFHVSETYGLGFNAGAAGVDVFFVISGFIMWSVTARRPPDQADFLLRRITRVVPLYWLVTVVTVVVFNFKSHLLFGHDASLQTLPGSLFFIPSIVRDQFHPAVIQGWTLCYEMMFYLIFALLLRLPDPRRFLAVIAALVFLTGVHWLLPAGHARVFTQPIILEFAAGVAIAHAWRSGFTLRPIAALALILLGLVGLLAASRVVPDADRVIRWGVPAALIVGGSCLFERGAGLPRLKFLHLLGDASYSIYLWHVLVSALLVAVCARLQLPTAAQPVLVAAGSVILSLLLYGLIEKPLLQWLQGMGPRSKLAG